MRQSPVVGLEASDPNRIQHSEASQEADFPSIQHPTITAKGANGLLPDSATLTSHAARRRHPLPLNLLHSVLWNESDRISISAASQHLCPQATATTRTTITEQTTADEARESSSALHQETPTQQQAQRSRSGHRHTRSAGAKSSTFSHPVLVRTYATVPARFLPRRRVAAIQEEDESMEEVNLPALEEFSFDNILRAIEPDIASTLDAIAQICATHNYSLADQYDAHIAPQQEFDTSDLPPDPLPTSPRDNERPHDNRSPDYPYALANEPASVPNEVINASSAAYGTLEEIMAASNGTHRRHSDRMMSSGSLPRPSSMMGSIADFKRYNRGSRAGSLASATPMSPRSFRSRSSTHPRSSFAFLGSSSTFLHHKENARQRNSPMNLISGLAHASTASGRLRSKSVGALTDNDHSTNDSIASRLISLPAPEILIGTQVDLDLSLLSNYPELDETLLRDLNGFANTTAKPNIPSDNGLGNSRRTFIEGFTSWLSLNNSKISVIFGASRSKSESNAEGSLRGLLRGSSKERPHKKSMSKNSERLQRR
ncbi:MAG: hypothetical protein M1829_004730 [Trizodia sp. TS-e1964]|nr:MAG: hypothetical protein M1829_004730 [Trizodia sp. TS-e1964]